MEPGPNRHILYLSRWYPSKADPMLGLFVRKHALAAVDAGFTVSVVFAVAGIVEKRHELFSTEVTAEGRLTQVVVTYRKSEEISGLARQLIAWNLGIQTAVQQNGKPGLIHAHILTRTALLAWYFGRKWHIPYIITEHWSRYFPENFQYKGRIRKRLTRFVVRKAAKTTVVSNRLAKAMEVAGVGSGFSSLPNVVDTRLFNIAETGNRKPAIISITCFEEKSKNLKMLIDAFTTLIAVHKNAELVLVGEGADLDLVRRYAAEKKLAFGAIRFTGLLEGTALAEELQQAACLALTSNYETFGIVAYEAMACGVPVVATDVADLKDFIKPGFGKIVPVGDTPAFSNALSEVLKHPEQFNQAEIRSHVLQQFGFEAVSRKLSELYQEILYKKEQ